ncbi:MAG TPA: hypothetical protein VI911_10835 [Patescibacteria group bacterium]|nr:hypothetical protein [Patescibacteria group bacterium]
MAIVRPTQRPVIAKPTQVKPLFPQNQWNAAQTALIGVQIRRI